MSHSNTISTNGRMYRFQPGSNTFQQPFIRWKGKTFTQIFATLKKNTYSLNTRTTPAILKKPLPLKLVRKEFANIPKTNIPQSQRTNVKIDDFNMPNGAFITNLPPTTTGFSATTLDINYINNLTEHPGMCKSFDNGKACMTTENNARHRVRSAGMYPKKFNTNRNNDSVYHSSTNDYLVSRTKTFQQNQFQYFRSGVDNKYKTGQNYQSYFNDYSPQGIPHCYYSGNISTTPLSQLPHRKVVYKPNNWKFGTQGAVEASGLSSHKNTLCNRMCALPPSPITEPIINYGPELVKNGDFSYPLVPTTNVRLLNNNDIENFGWLMEFSPDKFPTYRIVNNKFNVYYTDPNVNQYLFMGLITTINQNIYISTSGEYKLTLNCSGKDLNPNSKISNLEISIDNDVIGYINGNDVIPNNIYIFSKKFIINDTPKNVNLVIKTITNIISAIDIMRVSLKQVIK